jgi:polysaccharide pyruvyl transferase WcaK-like protein
MSKQRFKERTASMAQAMIGMRLHSWNMAMAPGVPSVAFVCDEKVERTISSLGLAECAISLEHKESRRSAGEIL